MCTYTNIILLFLLNPGPDDTVDLDFSLFQSHEDILYDALGDLSFDEDDIAIDGSDCKRAGGALYRTVCSGRL